MIQMRVREVSACAEHRQTVVVLEDGTGQQRLAIAVRADESRRLVRELSPGPDRDPIYDFVEALLGVTDVAPRRVVLEYEPDIGIRCVVVFERADGEASVPCDASDALALAHRLEIPLYVTDDVFSAPAQAASPPSPAREPDDVARWLDHVRPADFREERPEGDFPAG